jgi:hypothetical protein
MGKTTTIFGTLLFLATMNLFSQNVGISSDGSDPDNSAGLDVNFTDKGFLPPRLTSAQINLISDPAEGLIVYNIDNKRPVYYDGLDWKYFDNNALYSIPATDLVAYLPFNGDANDASGNGFDGTVIGALLTKDRFGNDNRAYKFDGDDDYILIDNKIDVGDGDNSSFTISAWVRGGHPKGNWNAVISTSNASYGIGYDIFYNSPADKGETQFELSGAGGFTYVYTAHESDTSIWHHLILVVDRSTLTKTASTYFDGQILTSNVNIAGIGDLYADYNTLIGRVRAGTYGSSWMHGEIDDIRIYRRALNVTEIIALYRE